MPTGARIIELRTQNGWSQYRLAKEVGTNYTTVQKWENGIALPRADKLIALAKTFNVSSDYLLCLDDRPQINTEGIPYDQCMLMEGIAQIMRNANKNKQEEQDKPEEENKPEKENKPES